jgi:YegS/Rv2252/BmrU family lipid kinase
MAFASGRLRILRAVTAEPRTVVVVNPKSQGGRLGKQWPQLAETLRRAFAFEDVATTAPGDATRIAREALRGGAERVVAVGGDGTINEVVNGFFEEARAGEPPRAIRPAAALGVLPRGTGGDFRKTLGLDGELRKCAPRLAGHRRAVDVGRIEYVADDGRPAARYFLNVAEAGVGAEVVRIANRSTKLFGGKATFALASVRALAGWRDIPVRFSLDGRPPEDAVVTTFAVANGRCFGGGMIVAPGARLDDGLFSITVWSGYGLADFALRGASMYDGSHVKLKGTRTATARSVRLEPGANAATPLGIEADGEPIGRLPATFTVLPGALQLVS